METVQGWDVPHRSLEETYGWIETRLREINDRLIGVVVTGDWANFQDRTGRSINSRLQDLSQRKHVPAIVDVPERGQQLLAIGAAKFLQHNLSRKVAYLDSLPELELFIERSGQYEWINLLETGRAFVEGGKKWSRSEPISGLAVRQGATSVRLTVFHEEHDGVREIEAPLPETPDSTLPAELNVSVVPAQGNARLELRILQGTANYV